MMGIQMPEEWEEVVRFAEGLTTLLQRCGKPSQTG